MKDTRVNIRLPQAEKEQWETAAAEYGLTLTEFVTRSVRGTLAALSQQVSGNSATTTVVFGGDPVVTYASWSVGGGKSSD